MSAKKILTIVVACLVVVGLAVAAYSLQMWDTSESVGVEGGFVLEQTDDNLTIRCLSPDMNISIEGFEGEVTIINSFPGSMLEGYDGSVVRNGTVLSFNVDSSKGGYRLVAPEIQEFSFAVMGDSQGRDDILEDALNMTAGCDFIIHCGDLTPSGSPYELSAVEDTLNTSGVPVFTSPGNHDIKTSGLGEYVSRFGSAEYAFNYGGVRFAFLDSSSLGITSRQISWLEKAFAGADRKVIVTHGTSYDPFEGNHTLDPESAERLQNFATENGVTAVFSGHVHAYYVLRVDNTDFIITGGAGGSLTAGNYHWLRVNVTASAFDYDKVDIDYSSTLPSMISLKGHGITKNLTLEELSAMQLIEGDSSYQNQFGNIAGVGHYKGVSVSALLALVGSISEGKVLRITASDGYYQEYGYGNVNPNSTWLALQGQMILALEFDTTQPPDWQDGPRIAMLPSDGLYSNSDCDETSYPGQGYSVYPSAGARWVKNVVTIEVVG